MNLQFNEEETAQIRNIFSYYDVVKELLIFGEQIDPENRTLTQPLNELRNCLDHLSRAVLFKLGLRKNGENDGYIKTNLDKSFGHVYRAAYDTLDWVSLTLKELIIEELKGFSLDTINHAFPAYYSRIRPRFEKIINSEIAGIRTDKDVAATNENNLIKYGEISLELKSLYQEILDAKPALIEYESKLKKQNWIGYVISFVIGGGLISIVLWLLRKL